MFKIGEAVGVYRYQQKLTVQAGGTKTFRGPPVRQNLIAIISLACVTDYTRNDRQMLIGKTGSGDTDHVVKVLPVDKGHSLELAGEMILLEDEKPYAQVYAPDLDDEIYVTFHGLLYKRESNIEEEE